MQNNYIPRLIESPEKIFVPKKDFKILLLRHDRLGDVLISMPFLKELRSLLPDSRIDILMSFKNKTTSRAVANYCDKIYILDNKPMKFLSLIGQIRRQNYDLVIDLFDNESATSNLILKYSKAKEKLGFDKSNSNNYTYTVPIPDKGTVHIAERLFSLLLPFGHRGTGADIRLEFPLNEKEKEQAIELLGKKQKALRLGINLTGSDESKYWGNENYIKFINSITRDGDVEVVLFAVPRIEKEAKLIARETSGKLAPVQKDFFVYAAMLNECDIILTPDTAAVHLAAAFAVPVVALFLSAEPQRLMPWYPLGTKSKSLLAKNNIAEISVDEVITAFYELIAEAQL